MATKRGPHERHYAVSLDGSVMTFECREGHTYKLDMNKSKRPSQQVSEMWLQRMLRYWSRENGGVGAARWDCRKCKKADQLSKQEAGS